MGRLAKFSSNPTLRTYMQGAALQAIPAFQQFLAPTVDVASLSGFIKKWDSKTGLLIPDTKRGNQGEAAIVGFDISDTAYRLIPNALDYPVDKMATEDDDILNELKEGADITAQLGALAALRDTTDAAMTALGAGTNVNIAAGGADLIKSLNTAIRSVILGAKGMGPMMETRLLWGFDAFKDFTEHSSVRSRFVAGKKESSELTVDNIKSLFVKPVSQMINEVVYDASPNKDAADTQFLMGRSVIVFAACTNPTRYDTSFMKTLRKRGAYMAPRFHERADGRVEYAGFDWNEQVVVGNAGAAVRINFTDA